MARLFLISAACSSVLMALAIITFAPLAHASGAVQIIDASRDGAGSPPSRLASSAITRTVID